jgi:hypothetical protein
MRILSALLVGLFSGFLIYMMSAMLAGTDNITPWLILVTFLGGWGLSTFLVLNGATTSSKVWARGGLLGAAEWMLAGLVAVIYSGKTLGETHALNTSNSAYQAGAVVGAGVVSMMGIGLAVFMAITCLIVYFIASRTPKEFQPETVRIKCPQCAEFIAAEAKKCRFCGYNMGTA